MLGNPTNRNSRIDDAQHGNFQRESTWPGITQPYGPHRVFSRITVFGLVLRYVEC